MIVTIVCLKFNSMMDMNIFMKIHNTCNGIPGTIQYISPQELPPTKEVSIHIPDKNTHYGN